MAVGSPRHTYHVQHQTDCRTLETSAKDLCWPFWVSRAILTYLLFKLQAETEDMYQRFKGNFSRSAIPIVTDLGLLVQRTWTCLYMT